MTDAHPVVVPRTHHPRGCHRGMLDHRHKDEVMWVTEIDDKNRCQVKPLDDVMEHEDHHKCPCGPQLILMRAGAGQCHHIHTRWMVKHHSVDGREHNE